MSVLHSWWRRLRLQRISVDDALWQLVCAQHVVLRRLPAEEQTRLRLRCGELLAHKNIVPAQNYQLDDHQLVTIAALAALPLLHLPLSLYDSFYSFIIYPDEFQAPRYEEDEDGVVHVGVETVSGEAWEQGPILLSWADIVASFDDPSYNVVVHECVHKLDLGDGDLNGVPSFSHSELRAAQWQQTMSAAWQHFTTHCDEADFAFDDYGANSPAEFFAVMSEYFFGEPQLLASQYPDLYQLFCRYYQTTPLSWKASA